MGGWGWDQEEGLSFFFKGVIQSCYQHIPIILTAKNLLHAEIFTLQLKKFKMRTEPLPIFYCVDIEKGLTIFHVAH